VQNITKLTLIKLLMSYQQEIVGAPFFAAPCIDDYTSVSKSKKLS